MADQKTARPKARVVVIGGPYAAIGAARPHFFSSSLKSRMRLIPLGKMAIDMKIYYGRPNDRSRRTGEKVRAVRHRGGGGLKRRGLNGISSSDMGGAVCDEYL